MGKFLLFMLCLGAVIVPKIVVASDQFEGGKELFSQKCVMCHGVNGDGQGPAQAAFSPPPTNFTTPEFWKTNDINQFITTTIKNGHGSMPAFDLPPEKIQEITDYMSHAFRQASK